jgi:hypothetical protein
MTALSNLVSFTIAICALLTIDLPASATSADITGTWQVTIHYPQDGDYQATYILKQDGQKITGTYNGMYGPADVTGTIKSDDVLLNVTVHGSTAHFSGKVSSATKMSGTVKFVLDDSTLPPAGDGTATKWSAEKKAEGAATFASVNQHGVSGADHRRAALISR